MAALPNIGVEKKRRAVLSNCEANVFEAWQLWLERDVVKRVCFIVIRFAASFSNYASSKSHRRPTEGQNLQIFAPPQIVGNIDRAPSDLRYKITSHSDILAKVSRGGVLRHRRLEREKINKSQ